MNIKIDGDHNLDVSGEGRVAVLVSGVTGGATMQLAYKVYGTSPGFVNLVDGLLTIDNQYVIDKGENSELYMIIAGATGTTDIEVTAGAA